MGKVIDLTGQRFGRLTVVCRTTKPTATKSNSTYWECCCDCGKTSVVDGAKLKNGHTKSCGCLRADDATRIKHNGRRTRLYRIWCAMKDRCAGSGEKNVKNYSGRGIVVCDEWVHDFAAFRDWAMANGYSDDLTLDRKDNDGPYAPWNCRWASQEQQCNNKRNNHKLTYQGKTLTMAQLAKETGIKYSTLRSRINRDGLSAEEAVLKEKAHENQT